mmetsp:Transcript_23618/g.62246  ORF Transcript_23618/g.62246 Transcript_23618/m.62246 type:complete len:272 (+) Transcript_23618:468-1283(+)
MHQQQVKLADVHGVHLLLRVHGRHVCFGVHLKHLLQLLLVLSKHLPDLGIVGHAQKSTARLLTSVGFQMVLHEILELVHEVVHHVPEPLVCAAEQHLDQGLSRKCALRVCRIKVLVENRLKMLRREVSRPHFAILVQFENTLQRDPAGAPRTAGIVQVDVAEQFEMLPDHVFDGAANIHGGDCTEPVHVHIGVRHYLTSLLGIKHHSRVASGTLCERLTDERLHSVENSAHVPLRVLDSLHGDHNFRPQRLKPDAKSYHLCIVLAHICQKL